MISFIAYAAATAGATGALAMLNGESNGLAIDFTGNAGKGEVAVKDTGTPANDRSNVDVDAWLTNSGTSPKLVRGSDGYLKWSPHNLFVNPSAPATQNVTLIVGATYTFAVTGTGSLAGSAGASGTATAGSPATFVATTTTGTFTVTGSLATIQINRGSAVTAFLDGGASTRFGVPIQYDGTSAYTALVEPQATNKLIRGIEFDVGGWSNAGATFSGTTATAPDGSATARTLLANSGTTSKQLYQITAAPTASATQGVFAKAGSASWLGFSWNTYALNDGAFFNLATGEIGNVVAGNTAGMVAFAAGWYYCWMHNPTPANRYCTIEIHTANNQSPSWNAAGTETVLLWGGQYVDGTRITSPIPTYGATVTRSAEALNKATSAVPSMATAGTIYLKGRTPNSAEAGVLMSLDDGTANERFRIEYTGTNLRCLITDGGTAVATLDLGAVAVNTNYQVSLAWAANDVSASLNGAAVVGPDTSVTLPTVTTLRLGYSPAGERRVVELDKLVAINRRVVDGDLPTWRYVA